MRRRLLLLKGRKLPSYAEPIGVLLNGRLHFNDPITCRPPFRANETAPQNRLLAPLDMEITPNLKKRGFLRDVSVLLPSKGPRL